MANHLYDNQADFIQGAIAKSYYHFVTYRLFIDDVLSLNNCKLGDFVGLIYPIEFEIKDTTDTTRSALYLAYTSKLIEQGSVKNQQFTTQENFHCIYSYILVAPVYGVYISRLIRYSRACGSYRIVSSLIEVAANKEEPIS